MKNNITFKIASRKKTNQETIQKLWEKIIETCNGKI